MYIKEFVSCNFSIGLFVLAATPLSPSFVIILILPVNRSMKLSLRLNFGVWSLAGLNFLISPRFALNGASGPLCYIWLVGNDRKLFAWVEPGETSKSVGLETVIEFCLLFAFRG